MSLVTWKSEYELQISQVDSQHRRLVELLNGLHDSMRAGKGKEAVAQTLEDLITYTKTHFAFEENLMRQTGYPEYAGHKATHDKIAAKVLQYQQEFQAGKPGVTVELMNFIRDWLVKHIQGTDKKYVPHLHSKGVH